MSYRSLLSLLFIVGVSGLNVAQSADSENSSSSLSLANLVELVAITAQQVTDLSAKYEYEGIPLEDFVQYIEDVATRRKVTGGSASSDRVKTRKTSPDQLLNKLICEYKMAPGGFYFKYNDLRNPRRGWESSFDGRLYVYKNLEGAAEIDNTFNPPVSLLSDFLFGMPTSIPVSTFSFNGVYQEKLIDWLRRSLRDPIPPQVRVEGVIAKGVFYAGSQGREIWFDLDKAGAVIKMELFGIRKEADRIVENRGESWGQHIIEFEDHREVSPGLWLPFRISAQVEQYAKHVGSTSESEIKNSSLSQNIKQRLLEKKYRIARHVIKVHSLNVRSGLTAEDLALSLEPGTPVYSRMTGKNVVFKPDLKRMEDQIPSGKK